MCPRAGRSDEGDGHYNDRMKFCSACGGLVVRKVPSGDNRERFVCETCGAVHYVNPKVVSGCLVTHEGAVLLCRRAIQPGKGLWTLPAGFLELGETIAQGAARETFEEANAKVEIDGLYTVFSLPHISQIYVFFRARLLDGKFAAGAETADAKLFDEHEIPWQDLAFPVVTKTLRHYFADRSSGQFPVYAEDIVLA